MDFSKSLLDNILKRPAKDKKELENEYNEYMANLGID